MTEIESDNDVSVQLEEDGFKDAYANVLLLDSIGQSYVEFIPGGRRLMRVISIEFRDLNEQNQNEFDRNTNIHYEIYNE